MTLDLAELRQLTAKLQQEVRANQQALGHFVGADEWDEAKWLEALSPQAFRRMLANYVVLLPPTTALDLIDRLACVEQRLDLLRERLHAYASREELLAILAADEALYPTLMTQVGKDKP